MLSCYEPVPGTYIPLTRKDQTKPICLRLLNTNYHEHKHSKPLTRHD